MTVRVDGRVIEVTHPDKVLFPGDGITKRDVVEYYRRIAPVMLPHVRDRALTLHRFPDGIDEDGFYQKNASDYFPSWIETVTLAKEGGEVKHVVCTEPATMVYLATQACITLHVSLSRVDRPDFPDRMIFDIDPPKASHDNVGARRTATRIRSYLEERGLLCYVMTTGSSGYHVVVPIKRERRFDDVRAFARSCAKHLADRYPGEMTIETRLAARGNRVFVDYLRNAYGQTGVAAYALRARPSAPVATPIEWDELTSTDPQTYRLSNVFRRLGQKEDPWRDVGSKQVDLPTAD